MELPQNFFAQKDGQAVLAELTIADQYPTGTVETLPSQDLIAKLAQLTSKTAEQITKELSSLTGWQGCVAITGDQVFAVINGTAIAANSLPHNKHHTFLDLASNEQPKGPKLAGHQLLTALFRAHPELQTALLSTAERLHIGTGLNGLDTNLLRATSTGIVLPGSRYDRTETRQTRATGTSMEILRSGTAISTAINDTAPITDVRGNYHPGLHFIEVHQLLTVAPPSAQTAR